MRDILSKVMTGSMIAGAALLVAACGGGGSEANNTADNGLGTDVYNTELPSDLNSSDMNGLGNGMGNVSSDLSNASNAVGNASEAINNAQSNTSR